jgi:uncharacterized protein YbjT (DUF2867 family)
MMIVVTGAGGLNGAAVIGEFARRGLPVRALVRGRTRLDALPVSDGVEVIRADMTDAAAMQPVLDGARRVLMISAPDEHLVHTQTAFIDAAQKAGVPHIVKFSGRGCWPSSPFRFARFHAEIEHHLERSGVAWTQLRPSQFMQVFLRESRIVRDGVLALPMGEHRTAPVDVGDIARIAVELLLTDGHEGRRYEITGPEALTMTEVAERLTVALDRPVHYRDVDPAVYRRYLLATGASPFFADAVTELFAERRTGNSDESRVDLSTHRTFGITPTTFAAFARHNAEAFRAGAGTPS